MAVTRKGWRTLVVDGASYRWHVRKEPKYWDNHSRTAMRFIVESEQGALLIVELRRPRLDYWVLPDVHEELRPVTPREVEQEIKAALRDGWKSNIKGQPFHHKVM